MDKAKQVALLNQETTYMGKPCIRGHDGKRYTRNGDCYFCRNLASAYRYKKKRLERGLKKKGRPRKYPELFGPPKPKREIFKPITVEERWIARSKGNKKRKARKDLPVEFYKSILSTHCPLLEIELSYELYKGNSAPDNYATLDKINPKKGYVKGNVQIVSYRANTLKNDASIEEIERMLKNWKKLYV
jgi:hypothetical protein